MLRTTTRNILRNVAITSSSSAAASSLNRCASSSHSHAQSTLCRRHFASSSSSSVASKKSTAASSSPSYAFTAEPAESEPAPINPVTGKPLVLNSVTIDMSGLMGMKHDPSEHETLDDLSHKSAVTPLVQELQQQIKVKGPLSVSDYMFQCLQNQQYGYYTSQKPEEIIGPKVENDLSSTAASSSPSSSSRAGGDFITSPELGQIFGEMLGIWVISTWEQLGRPTKWKLVELGPGRGTLMYDMLRTISRFPEAAKGVEVRLCETSATMREEQIKKLKVQQVKREIDEASTKERLQDTHKPGYISPNPYADPTQSTSSDRFIVPESVLQDKNASISSVSEITSSESAIQSLLDSALQTSDQSMSGVINLNEISSVTDGKVMKMTSHLPMIDVKWHTKVSQAVANEEEEKAAKKADRIPTKSSSSSSSKPKIPIIAVAHEFLDALPVYQFQMTDRGWCEKLIDMNRGKGPHHFRYVLSAQPTVASRTFLPPNRFPPDLNRLGDQLEIGAAGLAAVEDLSHAISEAGGAALLIDYGTNHPNANTLQGVQKHQYKDVLEEPGRVDLTTLVDFKSVRATIERSNARLPSPLAVLPLVTQSHFLRNLNIAGRLDRIVREGTEGGKLNEEQMEVLISNALRLVTPHSDEMPDGMGSHFKCMCIVSSSLEKKEIVPFNIPDTLMQAEDAQYEKEMQEYRTKLTKEKKLYQSGEKAQAKQEVQGHIYSDGKRQEVDPERRLKEQLVTKAAEIVNAVNAINSKPPSSPSSSSSSSLPNVKPVSTESLASRAEARRAAARQAAEDLARARAARTAAEETGQKK